VLDVVAVEAAGEPVAAAEQPASTIKATAHAEIR
jgi:hypothetical protein